MKITVAYTQTLRRLDTTLYSGSPATVGTQFGDITVRKALTPGYVAEIGDGELPDARAYGLTPAVAFLALGEALKDEQQRAQAAAAAREQTGWKLGSVVMNGWTLEKAGICDGDRLIYRTDVSLHQISPRDLCIVTVEDGEMVARYIKHGRARGTLALAMCRGISPMRKPTLRAKSRSLAPCSACKGIWRRDKLAKSSLKGKTWN
jgi:hypothetical protein